MGGFKSGSTDPYADDDTDEEEASSTVNEGTEESLTAESSSTVAGTTGDQTSTPESNELPYITRRRMNNESTQWQRSRLTFFVRDDVERGERELKGSVEKALGEEVSKFDLREAAYLVAQEHPEAVAKKLKEMGVGFKM